MGFCEVLTLVFVIMKCTGHLDWSWWQVFIPEYVSAFIVVAWFVGWVHFARKLFNSID